MGERTNAGRSPARNVVIGQRLQAEKVLRSRELRRAMTDAEWLLWQALRANQVRGLHFRRQQVIDGFIVDFYCHAIGLVVEVDGPVHAHHEEYDAARDQLLTTRGLRLLRVSNDDVEQNLTAILTQILAIAERHGSR